MKHLLVILSVVAASVVAGCANIPGSSVQGDMEFTPLHVVDTRLDRLSPKKLGTLNSLTLIAKVADAQAFAESLAKSNIAIVSATEDEIVLELPVNTYFSVESVDSDGRFTNSSFVIDYHEPSVEEILSQLKTSNPTADTSASTQFVDTWITEKTEARGFDIASQVAASREGDCTEHAVLLTAVNRALGIPARVVLGVVIVGDGQSVQSFGHAWTEVHDGTQWRTEDAALNSLQVSAFYLPTGVIEREGPGYLMSLLEAQKFMPTQVILQR